jgi:DNA-binding MarR family transcriptional regulator
MYNNDKMFQTHCLYNLSRYLFLKMELRYSEIVEKSGITLPQLRVLWIIKSFPGITLKKIAQFGCWSPPTVTKILKLLIEKSLVYNKNTPNKKEYNLALTEEGEKLIELNKHKRDNRSILMSLVDFLDNEELDYIIDIFSYITIRSNNSFIFEFIDKVNDLSLKIDYSQFSQSDFNTLKKLVCFYNLLRTFVKTVEKDHSKLLKSLDLTYPQLRALGFIKAFPGLNSIELSIFGLWAPSTTNVVVRNLSNKDLITKEKGLIKNSIHLYISKSGEKLLIEDFEVNQKKLCIHKTLESISSEELLKLNGFLSEMNKKIGNEMLNVYIERIYIERADEIN